MGTVKVTNIEPIADNGTLTIGNSGDTIALTSGAKTSGFGKIGQVKSLFTANQQTTTSTSFVDVTGMSQTITPSTTSSKVLVTCSFFAAAIPSSKPYYKLLRGSTILGQITVDGIDCTFSSVNPQSPDTDRAGDNVVLTFLDSPASTSEQTYKLQFRTGNSSYTAYFGRRDIGTDTNAGAGITLMEILD
jgi:hypothetical protein